VFLDLKGGGARLQVLLLTTYVLLLTTDVLLLATYMGLLAMYVLLLATYMGLLAMYMLLLATYMGLLAMYMLLLATYVGLAPTSTVPNYSPDFCYLLLLVLSLAPNYSPDFCYVFLIMTCIAGYPGRGAHSAHVRQEAVRGRLAGARDANQARRRCRGRGHPRSQPGVLVSCN